MNDPRISIPERETYGLVCKYLPIESDSAPLITLIHGRAGNVDVMWTFRRSFPDGVNIVSVEAPIPDKEEGGFSWWEIYESKEIGFEQKTDGLRLITEFIDRFKSDHGLNPSVQLAAGFSQGAGMLSLLIQQDDNMFAGAALLAGFVLPQEISLEPKKTDIFVAHGTLDETISIEKAKEGIGFLTKHGYQVRFVEDKVGHKAGVQGMRGLKEWSNALIDLLS